MEQTPAILSCPVTLVSAVSSLLVPSSGCWQSGKAIIAWPDLQVLGLSLVVLRQLALANC